LWHCSDSRLAKQGQHSDTGGSHCGHVHVYAKDCGIAEVSGWQTTLQRTNTENSKQIFLEKEYRGHSVNFHIHVSVSDLYIPMIDLPILLQEIYELVLGIYKWLTDTQKEYIKGIFVAV
jgi:hypothetical protein